MSQSWGKKYSKFWRETKEEKTFFWSRWKAAGWRKHTKVDQKPGERFCSGQECGLVVMGGDSYFEGRGFESHHHILDGHFFTFICCKNCNVCMKKWLGKVHMKKINVWADSMIMILLGQLRWLNWQSGCFRYKRSMGRIQSSAKFYNECIYSHSKMSINKKEARNFCLYKKTLKVCDRFDFSSNG